MSTMNNITLTNPLSSIEALIQSRAQTAQNILKRENMDNPRLLFAAAFPVAALIAYLAAAL